MGKRRKQLLLLAILTAICGFQTTMAQVESDERPLLVSADGIGFKKDSVFLMNMRFRMQNRFGYFSALDQEAKPGFEAVVRRLRLRFDGFVLHPKIGYYIQLSFSRSDQDLISGTVAQTVRDAMVYYAVNKRLYFGFGQSKLPGNRERVISSGNLQMPDRSIANQTFTLDRDFGFFGYYTRPVGKQLILIKTAVTGGEGRGQAFTNDGLAFTGRVEWLPFGPFRNLGDYSQGDIEFEPTPKLSLAAGYSHNLKTTRSGGQLGSVLPNPVDMSTFIADAMFKYTGWGFMGEYFYRQVNGYTLNADNRLAMLRIPRGAGFNLQASRMLSKRSEIVARFAGVNPPEGFEDFQYKFRTKALGFSHYLNEHRVKFQYYIGLDDRLHTEKEPLLLPVLHNRLHTMLQVELGI